MMLPDPSTQDRVGLGWRGELATGILSHLDAIDVLEVIAENLSDRRDQDALRELGRQVPVYLHGVSMGLASCHAVSGARIDAMAKLVHRVEPAGWSEHLAFVRAGGIEIGHLAAPPRTRENVDGALANIARATHIVGAAPLLENIATLIDPPGSELDETHWLGEIVRGANAPMLIDLHNLYANAMNFGCDPLALLHRMPVTEVAMVHLSGGVWLNDAGKPTPENGVRLLDDHLHDVPPPIFDLLESLASVVKAPLAVIIERDGRYPPFESLLAQIERARAALARGRATQSEALAEAA